RAPGPGRGCARAGPAHDPPHPGRDRRPRRAARRRGWSGEGVGGGVHAGVGGRPPRQPESHHERDHSGAPGNPARAGTAEGSSRDHAREYRARGARTRNGVAGAPSDEARRGGARLRSIEWGSVLAAALAASFVVARLLAVLHRVFDLLLVVLVLRVLGLRAVLVLAALLDRGVVTRVFGLEVGLVLVLALLDALGLRIGG